LRSDGGGSGFEAVGLCGEDDFAGLLQGLEEDHAEAVEGAALGGYVGLVTAGVAVADAEDAAAARVEEMPRGGRALAPLYLLRI
jgi:hypothetical protein